jgi:hypothetical protein
MSTSEFDRVSADIPLWGWLSGANARRDRAEDRERELRQQRLWERLGSDSPTVDQLAPEYRGEGTADEYGDLMGGASAFEDAGPLAEQRYSMDALRRLYESGGYTEADRAQARAARSAMAQQVGGMNRAALAQLEARGGGGGGAALAAQLGGSQALANAGSQADAAMQGQAMQRAMMALQGYQSGGQFMAQQDAARRSALDDFNARNTDWRRGRESRNTAWSNQSSDARANAYQQNWRNRADALAGQQGNYAGGMGAAQANRNRQDNSDQAAAAGVGTLITSLLG